MTEFEKPQRIQLSRKKGWRMPPNTVKVDRSTKFGNPFEVGIIFKTRLEVVAAFRWWIANTDPGKHFRAVVWRDFRHKNLACWCPLNQPCHADVLLEIANG